MSTRPSVIPAPARTARRSTVVGGWTLVSRVTGLAKVIVLGAVLGPTYFANTFVTTNVLPSLIYMVIAGQALALVVVPEVARACHAGRSDRAAALLGHVCGFLLMASAGVAVLVVLAAPGLARLLTLGVPDAGARAQAHQLAMVLVMLVAPQVVLYCVAALGAAAQQARERFALAAAAPAVENVVLVCAVAFVGVFWGTGLDADEVPVSMVLALVLGSTSAVAAHAGLQLFGAWRAGMPIRPRLRWWSDRDAVVVARRLGGSISVMAAPPAGLFTLLTVAATVPGGVVVVQAAYALFQVPTALGSRAVSTAVLPGMSVAAGRGDDRGFARSWREALSFSVTTSLPPLVFLGLLAHPVAHLLAHGELRTPTLLDQLTACVAVVAVGQVAAGLHEIGRQTLFARLDIAGPRWASTLLLIVTVAFALVSLLVPPGTERLTALCTALLAGELAGAAVVLWRVGAAVRPHRFADRRQIIAVALAAAAMVPAVAAGRWSLRNTPPDTAILVGALGLTGVTAVAVYAAVLLAAARIWTGSRS